MEIALTFLIALALTAAGVASAAWLGNRRRQAIVGRALAGSDASSSRQRSALLARERPREPTLTRLMRLAPSFEFKNARYAEKLMFAGFDDAAAPFLYATIRIVVMIAFPVLATLIIPFRNIEQAVAIAMAWMLVGWMLPKLMLDRYARLRQERIRKGLPDALDLLVVCVEAGISIDAAILRVAKELSIPSPDLARELMVVNRKTNAGIPREEALRALWTRTGVEELRMLTSSLIQSDKWGTSVTKVLRVSAVTFRRKRRQYVEKRVAMAPVKMTLPLVALILPALFIIVMGPAVLQLMASLRELGAP